MSTNIQQHILLLRNKKNNCLIWRPVPLFPQDIKKDIAKLLSTTVVIGA